MNTLNMSSAQVANVTRAVSPLVVDIGRGVYAWIQGGIGFSLDTRATATWHPLVDAVGLGGHVLTSSQVVALVARYGRPS